MVHTAKTSIAYLFFLQSGQQFCVRDGALSLMDAPLNYPFSILGSGKAMKDVIDYVKDTISLSYNIGTVPVFTQMSLTYMQGINQKITIGTVRPQLGKQV